MPRVSVTTSATLIVRADSDGTSVVVTNKDASAAIDIEINNASVASGSGYELAAGASVSADLKPGSTIHGIASSGTVTVHYLKDDGV